MASFQCVLVGNKNHLPRLFLTKKTMDMKLNLLFVFLIATQCLTAQSFSEKLQSPSFLGVRSGAIAFADVDGDGDNDVLITGRDSLNSSNSKLYLNDGIGNYSEVIGTPFDGVGFSSIAFSDVDGDRDQDVFIIGEGLEARVARLYTNDGTGNFTEVSNTPFEGVIYGSIACTDIDGDGDQDMLMMGVNNSNKIIGKLFLNDGQGNFTKSTGASFDNAVSGSIDFADVDGDGDQDVLITGQNAANQRIAKLYKNNGMGNFTEVIGTPFDGVWQSSIAFSDVDGDGDQDVLITGSNNNFQRIAKLYTNDGLGNFSELIGTPFNIVFTSSVEFADVDGDGDQDVLITGQYRTAQPISKLYTNDGTGNFTEMANTPFERVSDSSIAFADVDGDGDQDVLVSGANADFQPISKLYINNGPLSSTNEPSFKLNVDLLLYPNPVNSNHLQVNFESNKSGDVQVKIFDLLGSSISQQKAWVGTGPQSISVDISNLSSGSYILQLDGGKSIGVAKFIVP